MSDQPLKDSEPIPEDIRKALANAEPVPEDVLRRYDYMKEDFITALRASGRVKSRFEAGQGVVDAVFSLAGRLLRWADDVVADAVAPVRPALAGARSVEAREVFWQFTGRVARVIDGIKLEVTTWRDGDDVQLELNVLNADDGSEVRPFDVRVTDLGGNEIARQVDVGAAGQAPRFPGPSAGVYIFCVRWADGSGELRLEFEPARRQADENAP